MKYYDMHNDAYKMILGKGAVTWDGEKDPSNIFNHSINYALRKNVDKYYPSKESLKVLDLGTGTGTAALYLASLGFDATGFDVSEEAIAMADKNKEVLNLKATFQVQDILSMELETKFDLIIDSSFLHCIVFDKERLQILKWIKNHLTPDGHFFMHTMTESADMSDLTNRDYLIFKDEILWSTGKDSWDMDWQELDGKRVFPHRRIRTQETLENEIRQADLKIISKEIQSMEKNTDTFIAWLKA
jgi:2-polyprenyl-3-methyl-5-hydroxy-6-metoxy-1,4-benzoquinol methylase